MKKRLISIVISSVLMATTAQNAAANDIADGDGDKDHYVGAGIGAVAGALLAGPVGFVAGGMIGGLAGKHKADSVDEATAAPPLNEKTSAAPAQADDRPFTVGDTAPGIAVAHSGEIASVISHDETGAPPLVDRLPIADLNFNVFFLSGSTSVEAFYKPQLLAIAQLVQQLPDLVVHLDGYSDRRGSADQNLSLANQRLDAVRNELALAGVNTDRIHPNAYGEQRFVSMPGDLDAYTFDRRVVIRFEPASPRPAAPVALVDDRPAQ